MDLDLFPMIFNMFLEEEEEDDNLIRLSRRRSPRYRYNANIQRRMDNPEVSMLALQEALQAKDADLFCWMVRMDVDTYNYLLELVRPYLQKCTNNCGVPHSPEVRLAIALRYLSTGDSQFDISLQYGLGISTVCEILADSIETIYLVLRDEYLVTPSTEKEWNNVANIFQSRWNFPNCVGAIDGKHIVVKAPNNSGQKYFNYKRTFSLILLAVVDANYKFIYINAGSEGRAADGGVWKECSFKEALDDNDLGFPENHKLPGTDNVTPMFLVGDDAFPLTEHLLKPYSRRQLTQDERIFNYRLSRCRRVSENAFGIMANKFCIFLKAIEATPEHVDMMIVACCAMHNMLRTRLGDNYIQPGSVDFEDKDHVVNEGEWRRDVTLEGLAVGPHRNASVVAKGWRNLMCDYFASEAGIVPWQLRMIQ